MSQHPAGLCLLAFKLQFQDSIHDDEFNQALNVSGNCLKINLLFNCLLFFPSSSGLSQEQGSVEQISLHCSEGTLDWLYPKGALRLTLSPRLPSVAVGPGGSSSGLITACVKPSEQFHGAQLYLERDGVLELLVSDRLESSPPPRVRCFSRLPGERVALFLQATPHQDISRRIATFRYELRGDWTARLSLDSNPISSVGELMGLSAMLVLSKAAPSSSRMKLLPNLSSLSFLHETIHIGFSINKSQPHVLF